MELSRGVLGGVAVLASAATASAQVVAPPLPGDIVRTAYHDYRVTTVAEGFVRPWSIAFLPNGDMLVTERPGRLRIVRDGQLLPDAVPGVPEVHARGQGGLWEALPHPDFTSNRLLYLSYAKPMGGEEAATAVVRGAFENDHFMLTDEIFEAVGPRWDGLPDMGFGGKLAFDEHGRLFLTVGDRHVPPRRPLTEQALRPALRILGIWPPGPHPAQDLSNHLGVVARLNDDGSVPADNPFVGREGALPEIWSYGHRNPQGIALHPQTGAFWITEHGPKGGDEVNIAVAGANYGWPVIGYGVEYATGNAIHASTHADGMEQPVHVWVPRIATSGLMFYTGDQFPEWRGDLLAGGLGGQRIDRLTVDGERVVASETILQGMGRVRDLRQGPDGLIYVAIDGRDGAETAIVRLEPVR